MVKPAILLTIITVILILCTPCAYSQVELELLNTNIYWGKSYDIAVSGDRAFIANGEGGLRIMDISDDQNPLELEPLIVDNWNVYSLEVVDTLLFLSGRDNTNGGFLSIYDISELGNITEISYLHVGISNYDLKVNHNTGVLENRTVLNLSDPSNPIVACVLSGDPHCYVRDMDIVDSNTVILVENSATEAYIKFYDISNPEGPELISNYPEYGSQIFLHNQYAFLKNINNLIVYDISDVENMAVLDTVLCEYEEDSEYFENITFNDNDTAILLTQSNRSSNSRITTMDISDIEDIEVISVIQIEDETIGMAKDDNKLFFVTPCLGMNVYELQTLGNLERLYGYGVQIFIGKMNSANDGLSGINSRNGIPLFYTFNLCDPLNPEIEGSMILDQYPRLNSCYHNNYQYICYYDDGVDVINISDMSNPFLQETILTSSSPSTVLIIDDYIIYPVYSSGHTTSIAELNDPENIVTTLEGVPLAYNGEYLILKNSREIILYDFSNFESPQELGSTIIPNVSIYDISVTENMIYTILYDHDDEFGGDYYKWLYIDISDPNSPNICYSSNWGHADECINVYGIGDYLITEGRFGGIVSVYDYSDPDSSVLLGEYDHSSEAYIFTDLFWMDGYLYGYGGNTLQVFNFPFEMDVTEDMGKGLPTEYSILNAYPNPFNPTLNVGVSLPQPGDLQVKVYNINGQLVEVLANGRFSTGNHNLMFNGTNLSSGVYFINAVVPGQMNQTRKVTLVK